ncbi:MAG: anti-sigma factor [Gemmatimonadales bacterium]
MDGYTDRLSAYIDGELDGKVRVELENHLIECGRCRTALEELRRVVGRAGGLDDRPPRRDLWPGVADRIHAVPTSVTGVAPIGAGRTLTFALSVPQLAAASVTLVALTAGIASLATLNNEEQTVAANLSMQDQQVVFAVDYGQELDIAVGELESVLASGRAALDEQTVAVIEESLRQIDEAIMEARRALAVDPASNYLSGHLTNTMRRKLELLRRTQTLIATASL